FQEMIDEAGVGGAAQTIVLGGSGRADFNDLQDAIDACVAWQGDTILVEQTEDSAYGVDELVTMDKAGVTIKAAKVGINPEASGENVTFRGTAVTYIDGPTIKITAPCHIKGLGFTTRFISAGDADSAGMVIEGTGGYSGGFAWIENCRFSAWYGAQAYGIYIDGGALPRIESCTFDGLFGGFSTAAIGMVTPSFPRVIGNYFEGLGSSIPAVKLITSAGNLLMVGNYNLPGFGTRGVLLDNDSVVSTGLVGGNWTGHVNKAAAFLNLTNSTLSFQDNHYDE
ncbi:MAG: right-handed parallel beta-helix repeat-containing protein, partial [Planctomycetota bacterium]